MTTNYAGDPDNYPANVREPDDGDLSNATALAAAIEDLADRTANLNDRDPAGSRGIDRVVPATNCRDTDYGSTYVGWQMNSSGNWVQVDVAHVGAGAGLLYVDIPSLPINCQCTSIIVQAKGGGADHLPEHLPTVALYSYTPGGSNTLIQEVTDPSTTGGGYCDLHDIEITANFVVVDETKRYFLLVTGEYGTDSAVDFAVQMVNYVLELVP